MLIFFFSHSLYTIKPPKNNLSLEIKTELRCLFQTSTFLHVHHGDVQTLQPQLLVRFRFLRQGQSLLIIAQTYLQYFISIPNNFDCRIAMSLSFTEYAVYFFIDIRFH